MESQSQASATGRGRKLGRRQDSKESRDSSVSSTTREVRCGCQYFQSDSLLPERHTLVGTRPSSRNMGDHEYEPINPPPAAAQPAPPPVVKVDDQESEDEKITELEKIEFKSIFGEHQFLRIPLDSDMIIPIDKAEIDSLRYDDEEEEEGEEDKPRESEMTVQEIQDQMEDRFFAATPTTTISRTDGEFNTSQMDSSGLDELPLKKDARRGFNARGFQQRLQSQAGRIRTRIRNIPRPKLLPDRSKLHLPERPKFNLPERPKFNLPERPKFNIKRPDIKMPNFNFVKNKTSSLRRPLRDRSQIPSNQSTVGSKKNIFKEKFDSLNFRTYPRIFNKKKRATQGRRAMTPPPRMETESTPPSSPASRKGPFSQRWTQHFKDIKFADDDQQSDLKKPSFDDDVEDDSAPFREPDFKTVVALGDKKQEKAGSSISIPGSDREQQSSGSSSERHRAGVIEEIDSDEFFLREKGLSREDVDVSRYLSLEIRDAFRSPKNALARLDRDLYDDENEDFELEQTERQPGVTRPLTLEVMRNQSSGEERITPERDNEYKREEEEEDEELEEEEEEEPVRPERTRSLKKHSTRSKSEEPRPEVENQFNTSPNRPTRIRKQSSQSKHSIPPENFTDYNKENSLEMIARKQPSIPSLAITDTTKELSPTRYIDESSEALNEPWQVEHQPPLPPKRRKSTRDSSQDNESVSAHQYKEKWLEDIHVQDAVLDNMDALQRGVEQNRPYKNSYYDSPPQLPMRKSRSQGTSLADEDRTSRGADSLISETRTHLTEDLEVKPVQKEYAPDTGDYAFVEKTVIEAKPVVIQKPVHHVTPTSRRKKTAAHLTALKNQGINFFFTYPRRAIKKSLQKQTAAPIRPIRNYSSIGPSRPPRGNRVFREPVYEGEFIPLRGDSDLDVSQDKQKTDNVEDQKVESIDQEVPEQKLDVKTEPEDILETRDLQSSDVIEKMKDRPLPPPPRPPRKTKEDMDDLESDINVEETDLDDEENIVVQRIDVLISDRKDRDGREKQESEPRMVKPVEEVCVEVEKPKVESAKPVEEVCLKVEKPKVESVPAEEIQEPPLKMERRKKSLSVARTSQAPPPLVEATASTQTDRLPEGFYVEEEQQTVGDYSKSDDTTKVTEIEKEVEKRVETIVEHKVVVIPTPETEILKAKKLHVSELDVDKLNVVELQAQKITVSDIDGVAMQVTELSSKSGNLVISGFELPSSFLEAITPPPPPAPVIQIQSSTQTPPQTKDSQTNTLPQEKPLSTESKELIAEATSQLPISAAPPTQKRPSPPPSIVIQTPQGQSSHAYIPASPPPRSSSRTRTHVHDSEEELRALPRRRRHHSQKHAVQYSSDEDEEEAYPTFPIARRTHQREPTASELMKQLASIWQASFMRGTNHVISGLNSLFPEGEKRKDAQTAACIILVLIAGLIMLGFGSDKTVHHHHWDFLPPP